MDSLFFGKPLDVKHMIGELRAMVGSGTLKIIPGIVAPLAVEAPVATKPRARRLVLQRRSS
jgi:hypothetical protein